MVFSSILFLFYFFIPVVLGYYALPKKCRNVWLLIASLIFYAWGEPKYILLMLFSAVFNFMAGYFVDKNRDNDKIAKLWVVIACVVDLGLLVVFKYLGFFMSGFMHLLSSNAAIFNLALPIGISFYTFQALSYVIDVYRDDAQVQKNIVSFSLYLSMFPQLIAGPIVRYGDVAIQLNEREETFEKFATGMVRFSVGVAKKVLIANNIGKLWSMISGMDFSGMSMGWAWLGVFAFGMQLYFDFSGYSDMAIGLGKMFGFDFIENFNYPYISKSGTEFWRRWHISLGTWFREYVYIPLGGNRCSKFHATMNVLAVWALTGLWHGACWNYVLWGIYFGVILIIEKNFLLKQLEKTPAFVQYIYMILIVAVSWVLFGNENTQSMGYHLKALFNVPSLFSYDPTLIYNIMSYGVLIIVAIIGATPLPGKIMAKITKGNDLATIKLVLSVVGLFICIAYLVDDSYNPFLYFRF